MVETDGLSGALVGRIAPVLEYRGWLFHGGNSMTAKATEDQRSNDLQITVCRNGVMNVRNPVSGSGDVHSLFLNDGAAVRCTCKGHKFHGHCYHAEAVASNPIVLSSASSLSSTLKPVATGGGLPKITHHVEPPEVGGERYARCEGCGSESIFGVHRILHNGDCPRAN